jgi:hypothetical protein
MILSYREPETKLYRKAAASITMKPAGSGDAQPVIVLSTGDVVDTLSWNLREYQVVQATHQESHLLSEILNSEKKGGELDNARGQGSKSGTTIT